MPIPFLVDATWMNTPSYDAGELRRADASMFNGDGSAFGVLGGVARHGDNTLLVTANGDTLTIQPGAVVIPAGAGQGCYRTALAQATSGNVTARNATLPRIDLLIFQALDTDVNSADNAFTGRIALVDGVPANSPVAPALPPRATELARVTVPAANGGALTVDMSQRRFATALGGVLPVPSAARLPTAEARWDRAVAVDTGQEYVWDGTRWCLSSGHLIPPTFGAPAQNIDGRTNIILGTIVIPHLSRGATLCAHLVGVTSAAGQGLLMDWGISDTRVVAASVNHWTSGGPVANGGFRNDFEFPVAAGPSNGQLQVRAATSAGQTMSSVRMLYWLQQ